MANRDYRAPEIAVQDRRQIEGGRVAGADTRAATPIRGGDETWSARMLSGMLGQGAQVANRLADVEFSNRYLEGQAAAGVAESEEELQGNPMTRDWAVAGYRDTMGKLALADNEANFGVDIKDLRQKSPEEFKQYLSTRREKLVPGMEGMSREARAAAAGQMLLQDRAAMKQYTTERAKYIVETKVQAVATQWNASIGTLQNLQTAAISGSGSTDAYNEQLQNTAGMLVASVTMDKSLPVDVQREVITNSLTQALATDNPALYEYLSKTPVPDGQGGTSTLVSRLDQKQQTNLANQYREAMSRTSDMRNLYRMSQVADVEAQIDQNVYKGTSQDLEAMLNPMVANKSISGERRGTILKNFQVKQYKNEQESSVAGMMLQGDVAGVAASGKSLSEGMDAVEKTLVRRGVTPEQRLQTFLTIGKNGIEAGYKKAGEVLDVSVNQMVDSKDGKVLPQHAATFRAINASLREAESNGLLNTRTRLLSGMNEENRLFTEQVLRKVDTGATVEEAVQFAKGVQAQDNGLSPSIRAAKSAQVAKDVNTSVTSMEPRGLLDTMWLYAKSVVSPEAAADLKMRPTSYMTAQDGFFGNSPTVDFYTGKARAALLQEVNDVAMMSPSANAASLTSVAKANVAARTIQTSQGPIFMPRNVNLQTVFGVGAGNVAAIGPAIDGMLKETVADSRFQLSFDQGRLFAQEFDKAGQRVGNGMFIDPKDVRARIVEDTDKQTTKAVEQFGSGRTVSQDGLQITYNGGNNAGVKADWMFDYRSNLIDHEGIRAQPYNDLSGNKDKAGNVIQTVGVGVSSHNGNYPKEFVEGRVTSKGATDSFINASNEAAQSGIKVAQSIGLENKASFMLMSELAYQSGTAFMSQGGKTGDTYRALGQAMRDGNVEQAQAAFKRTAAWYYSRDPKNPSAVGRRQQSYLNLIEKAMKG